MREFAAETTPLVPVVPFPNVTAPTSATVASRVLTSVVVIGDDPLHKRTPEAWATQVSGRPRRGFTDTTILPAHGAGPQDNGARTAVSLPT